MTPEGRRTGRKDFAVTKSLKASSREHLKSIRAGFNFCQHRVFFDPEI